MEQTFYGDYIELDAGNFDLKLLLSIVSDDGKNKESQARIIMSWPQAKLLLYGLQTFLKAFELYNGQIRVPRASWPVKPEISHETEEDPMGKVFIEWLLKHQQDFVAEQEGENI